MTRGEATRRQAEALVASDPGLRIKHLNDQATANTGATEWEGMVELPLWMPGQRTARQAVAAALNAQSATLADCCAGRWPDGCARRSGMHG
ncbi:MAG: hypothetical protein ACUVQI_09705 [Thermochromatium sp.]